jgi:hypothetical protein
MHGTNRTAKVTRARPVVQSQATLHAMKIISWIFLAVGIACILFGLASCHHYHAVNPPLEAYQPDWNAEAHAEPYIALERFFYNMAGGVIALSLGFYLRGKARKTHS